MLDFICQCFQLIFFFLVYKFMRDIGLYIFFQHRLCLIQVIRSNMTLSYSQSFLWRAKVSVTNDHLARLIPSLGDPLVLLRMELAIGLRDWNTRGTFAQVFSQWLLLHFSNWLSPQLRQELTFIPHSIVYKAPSHISYLNQSS